MKLFYAASSVIPSRTANSVHVMRMGAALSRVFDFVRLYVPGWNDSRKLEVPDIFKFYGVSPTFEVIPVPLLKMKGKLLGYGMSLWREGKKWKPDYVYGRSVLGLAGAIDAGCPAFLEIHSPLSRYPLPERLAFRWFKRRKNFRGLIVISNALKKICDEEEITRGVSTWVLHDGADLLEGDERAPLPGSYQINVGYFGHLYRDRGIERILQLAGDFPQLGFHLIGGMPEDVQFWQEKVSSENLFFYGFVDPYKVAAYQRSCDIHVAPYQKHGATSIYMSPLKVFESMASGRPLLCSDLPVLREFLNASNSVLVSPTDLSEWRAGLIKLLEPAVRARIGNQAQKDIADYFSWNKRAEKLRKILLGAQ